MPRFLLPCLLVLSAGAVGAEDGIDTEACFKAIAGHLTTLPRLDLPAPGQARLPEGMQPFGMNTGIRLVLDEERPAVVVTGTSIFAQGPEDGLEVFACLKGGKNHESFMYLETENGQLVNAAFKAALNLPDGIPAPQGSCLPARGTPLAVQALWVDDPFLDEEGMVGVAASSLVRDRTGGQPWPALPYIYTGSHMRTIELTGPDGQPTRQEIFMLDQTKSLVVNFDEPDALLASPFPDAVRDLSFEVNSAIAPPKGTTVHLVFRRAVLPLELSMAADGKLSREGTVLDDAAIVALLRETFGAETRLRAVGVRVLPEVERLRDVEARERLLGLAVEAEVWAVPVFVLDLPDELREE